MNLSTKQVKNLPAVGLQLDHWASTSQYPFGNIHVTWISEDFQIHNISLGTFYFTGSHTSECIFDSVEGTEGFVEQYNLENASRFYVTDNASNCKSAFQGKANIDWLGCFAHTLHLIVYVGYHITSKTEAWLMFN